MCKIKMGEEKFFLKNTGVCAVLMNYLSSFGELAGGHEIYFSTILFLCVVFASTPENY
jgi:hypothetical protein